MKTAAISFAPLVMTTGEPQASLEAIRRTMEQTRKDPDMGRALLLATGMYTKSGRIKKRFR